MKSKKSGEPRMNRTFNPQTKSPATRDCWAGFDAQCGVFRRQFEVSPLWSLTKLSSVIEDNDPVESTFPRV
jgi:hypothetical protein